MKRNLSIIHSNTRCGYALGMGLLCLKGKPVSRRPAVQAPMFEVTRCGRSRCRIIGLWE